jgi:hypothetical protein
MILVKHALPLLFLALMTQACATLDPVPMPKDFTNYDCRKVFGAGSEESADFQLDRISKLFEKGCFKETVRLGTFVREQSRDKVYSLSGEIVELIAPEGSATPYVLESYERSYLSILISLSYLNLQNEDAARSELMRSYSEEGAHLYNYGTDPVMALLQAALWDRFEPENARPLWRQLSEFAGVDPKVKDFAVKRIEEIDGDGPRKVAWRIYRVGQLPDLEWGSSTTSVQKGGHYRIAPKAKFPAACSGPGELLMPASSWTDKIAYRADQDYHPLVYTKSFFRLPVAVTYGAVGFTLGTAVVVGGVAAAIKAESTEVAEASFQLGGAIFGGTGSLIDYTLAPDLRRWRNLPSAFLVTRTVEFQPQACVDMERSEMGPFALIE